MLFLAEMAEDPFVLKPLSGDFVPAIISMHAALLPIAYPFSFFLQLLLLPSRRCLVAYERDQGDTPVAFISAAVHPEHRIEILTLGVLPMFRQRGLATRLVYAVIDTLTQPTAVATAAVFAQVSASNESARAFYMHLGMHPTSTSVIRDMYRKLPCGSRDAYIVSGRITVAEGPRPVDAPRACN
ncbi:acyl-CoA N-acyltransferase [Mycena crocata]|nr:acyl-CoA N-acyltransferase [Mycena crocata]